MPHARGGQRPAPRPPLPGRLRAVPSLTAGDDRGKRSATRIARAYNQQISSGHPRNLTPGITRRHERLKVHESRRVGGRVHAVVRLRPQQSDYSEHLRRWHAKDCCFITRDDFKLGNLPFTSMENHINRSSFRGTASGIRKNR
jgi:hypothetical protein